MKLCNRWTLSILSFAVIGFSTASNAATITLSDYIISTGMTWSYIYTHDTSGEADEFSPDGGITGHNAGDEITVTEHPWEDLSLLPPSLASGDAETGTLYQFEPSIFAYYEIVNSLTVPEGTHNNVLRVLWLDSNFTANPVNQFGYTDNDWGVTDVNWFALGIGEIKFLGVGAGTGNIDGGFELTSAVPVPAAVWLFGSGFIGLISIARRKKA